MNTKTCTVKLCQEDRNWGDNLFCEHCRRLWRQYCKIKFGFDKQVAQSKIIRALEKYKTHLVPAE